MVGGYESAVHFNLIDQLTVVSLASGEGFRWLERHDLVTGDESEW